MMWMVVITQPTQGSKRQCGFFLKGKLERWRVKIGTKKKILPFQRFKIATAVLARGNVVSQRAWRSRMLGIILIFILGISDIEINFKIKKLNWQFLTHAVIELCGSWILIRAAHPSSKNLACGGSKNTT